MKQVLILIAVFGVAFAITLLFARDLFRSSPLTQTDRPEDPRADDSGLTARRTEAIERTMVPKEMKDVVKEVAPEPGAAAQPTTGTITGTVKTDDGGEPRDLKVTLFPAAPEARTQGGGQFVVSNLEPGTYYVGVQAPGYLARQPVEATVKAGASYELTIWLERGFELSGTVVDDVEQRPIAGATIDFNGYARVVSDAYGGFRTHVVPDKALEIITLTHDDFDRNVLLHQVIPEHTGIVLAMTRGKVTLTGRVIPPPGQTAPMPFRVRVISTPNEGQEDLRRERIFKDWAFEIRGVFNSRSILEVSFPDSQYAARRVVYEAGREPTVHVDVDFTRGGTIDGTYAMPGGIVANVPIQLVDGRNHPMGDQRTDAKGKFRFLQVGEGEYAIRMDARIPPIYTQSFHVEDGRTSTITVDFASGLIK